MCHDNCLGTQWRASRAIIAGHFVAFWSRDENSETSSTAAERREGHEVQLLGRGLRRLQVPAEATGVRRVVVQVQSIIIEFLWMFVIRI